MSPIQLEFQCKACSSTFDVLTRKPRALVPCGHSICEFCAQKLKECIECNEKIDLDIPNYELIKLLNSSMVSPSAPPSYLVAVNEVQPLQSTAVNSNISTTQTVQTHRASFSSSLRSFCSSLNEQFYDLSVKRKRKLLFFCNNFS